MTNLNIVVLEGNLVKDPELKYLGTGTAICSFTIGVNRSYKANGEWKEEDPSFFDVQCWGKKAEQVANGVVKGKGVVVNGRIKQERWENNGQARSKVIVVADNVFPKEARIE